MSLDLAYNFWFLICAVLLIAAFTLWVYHTTTPQVSPFLRRFLLATRILLLLSIVLLLFEVKLHFLIERVKKPVFTVLLDTSASMQLGNGPTSRRQQARRLVQQIAADKNLNQQANLQFVAFSDSVTAVSRELLDSLKFAGDGTNLSLALQQTVSLFQDEKIAGILLLSDGASNLGEDPAAIAENFPASINSVLIGAKTAVKDLWIKDIVTNKTAFAGAEIPVEVFIRAQGFVSEKTSVSILQDGQVLHEQAIEVPANGLEKKATLYLKPAGLGKQKLTATVGSLNGEITGRNNSQSFYMTILKSKLQILLLAAAPSADVTFIKQALEKDENFSLQQIVAVNNRKLTGIPLPKAAEIEKIDCIIAVNFARQSVHAALQNWLKTAVVKHEKPLLFLSGRIESGRQLSLFRELLHLAGTLQIGREQQVQLVLNNNGRLHPLFKTGETPPVLQVDALPPVFSELRSLKLQPDTNILATAQSSRNRSSGLGETGAPLVAVVKSDKQRLISIWANGLWRWKLLLQRNEQNNTFYDNFMQNCVRWLASRDENKLLEVKPSGDIFRSGEQIQFTAQAYYDDYRVRENLQVSLKIKGVQAGSFAFAEKGNGIYYCTPGMLPAGDYTYFSQASDNGTVVSTDSGKFSVIPFQWELQNTGANNSLLHRLAIASGGKMIKSDSLKNWLADLRFLPEKKKESLEVKLWQHWTAFLLLIFLLSLEWFLRKQKGML